MNLLNNLLINDVEILENEPLSKHTTFGIGGKAKYFLKISTLDALSHTIKFLNETNTDYIVIGDGTNLLVSDNFHEKIFIKLCGDFKKTEYNNDLITCGASVKLMDLAKETLNKGYGGLETIGSIPGSIGGACIMNAGVRLYDFSTYIHSVHIIDRQGNLICLPKDKCNYSYRESIFQYTKDYIIAKATIKLTKCDTAPLFEKLNQSIEKRKLTQPKGKCAGCFFKNSNNISSGKLIEECGLKGTRVGGAFVAAEHANFIMNDGSATAKDVLELANKIKNEVKKQKGHDLVFEVRIIE